MHLEHIFAKSINLAILAKSERETRVGINNGTYRVYEPVPEKSAPLQILDS